MVKINITKQSIKHNLYTTWMFIICLQCVEGWIPLLWNKCTLDTSSFTVVSGKQDRLINPGRLISSRTIASLDNNLLVFNSHKFPLITNKQVWDQSGASWLILAFCTPQYNKRILTYPSHQVVYVNIKTYMLSNLIRQCQGHQHVKFRVVICYCRDIKKKQYVSLSLPYFWTRDVCKTVCSLDPKGSSATMDERVDQV